MAASGSSRRRRLWLLAIVVAVALLALALAWRYTPLAELATAENMSAMAQRLRADRLAPIAVVIAYPLAAVLMFPRPLITLFAVAAFGPFAGFAYAMLGVLTSALATYWTGQALPEKTVDAMMTRRLRDIRDVLRERGLVAMLAISIVPVAPFVVVGMTAGTMRVKLRDYLGGVLLGHLPGTIATTIIGHQLTFALEDVASIDRTVIAGAALFLIVTALVVRRWFSNQCRALQRESNGIPGHQHAGSRRGGRDSRIPE